MSRRNEFPTPSKTFTKAVQHVRGLEHTDTGAAQHLSALLLGHRHVHDGVVSKPTLRMLSN